MDIISTVLIVGDSITKTLQCYELANMFLNFDFKSDLDEFQQTVERITASLRDAEKKLPRELSHETLDKIEKLKDVFYEADDLLDEFATRAQQQRFMDSEGTFLEKFRHFFSSSNPIYVFYYSINQAIKDFKKKLDAIAYKNQFSIDIDQEPIRKRSRETCSYVNEVEIIGRGVDLEKIVGMLLDNNVQHDVSFLSIVGIGGLGKTALAQLVFNDPRVTSAFPLRVWTCVSDQDQKVLNVKEILCKILGKGHESCQLDEVQKQLREQLAGNRFLLVLDDVWTEDRYQWSELEKYLTQGTRGSWIVVTTRSQDTALIARDCQVHKLEGLSKDNSWGLFEKLASPSGDLVEIGEEIIKGCAGVPLAIRVLGSLLYGQEKSRWESVRKIGFSGLRESRNGITPILELSYHHLESPLKSCFRYCALFPKDFVMEKEMLISLWLAQGYVVPVEEGQSFEDASEEYFSILLRRCFFQAIKTDQEGEIFSVKIHDLMHDLAIDVSGKEMSYATSTISGKLDKRVRHLSMPDSIAINELSLGKPHLRSYLRVSIGLDQPSNIDGLYVKELIKNCRSLRALDLNCLGITKLPGSIIKLLHLRYLNLSNNVGLKVLPESITNLYNLQILDLRACRKLTKLPKDLNRLVNLRMLDIRSCFELKYMPKNMNKLKYLTKLSDYIVGSEKTRCLSWNEWSNGLEDLKDLNNLNGCLRILIKWPDESVVEKVYTRKNLYLRSKEDLSGLDINFSGYNNEVKYILEDDIGGMENMEDEGAIALMEDLQPPSNLKYLNVMGYTGSRMPLDWACVLNKLVDLRLLRCVKVEYIEIFTSSQEAFLPVLERLVLTDMPKLKGWRKKRGNTEREESSSQLELLPCLSHLKDMILQRCPMLTCIPPCPNLENLILVGCPKMNMERDQA